VANGALPLLEVSWLGVPAFRLCLETVSLFCPSLPQAGSHKIGVWHHGALQPTSPTDGDGGIEAKVRGQRGLLRHDVKVFGEQ
jgi:hypothetical protein